MRFKIIREDQWFHAALEDAAWDHERATLWEQSCSPIRNGDVGDAIGRCAEKAKEIIASLVAARAAVEKALFREDLQSPMGRN